ncbi:MAG: tetratricopeptide repeat protein, partial [Woeseiaceae bacterium]
MTAERTFTENLTHRRVPQLVGMYIAATWLVIELGDWMTERFNLPPNLTSYVFIAMLVMLPAVILFAWNHGAPGKDRWTSSERVFIPANALAAVVVLYFLSPSLVVEAATETVQLEDETGTVQEFVVPRQGFHKEVVGFFWENDNDDPETDWLAYGLPLMLAHDLNRVSPVMTVSTPVDSRGLQYRMRNRGYDDFLNLPQGLMVDIARDRRSAAIIQGSFSDTGETKALQVMLIDVESGESIAEHSFSGSDWFTAIDDVSAAVLEYLDVQVSDNQSDDPVSSHLTDSIDAVQHYVNGVVAVSAANDYATAIAEYQAATALDPEFAEATGRLSRTFYLSGDVDSAQAKVAEALRNSYRLSEASKFKLKANRYLFAGDYDRGERALELWTQVQPNSTEALEELARINRVSGTPEGLQKASIAYDRLLALNPNDLDVYRQKAGVESQRGNYEAAIGYLRNIVDIEPDNARVLNQLADIYQAQGDLDAAQATLEDAALLSDDPLQPELGLARLEARRGLYENAESRLAGFLSDELGPQQRLSVLSAKTEIAMVRGHIERAMDLHAESSDIAKGVMPPVMHLVSIENQRSVLFSLLAKTEEAVEVADSVVAQLQPPMTSYLNITYTSIYAAVDDRENFREWAAKNQAIRDQLPDIFAPMLAMETARVLIWDNDIEGAVAELDVASAALGQSFIRQFRSNLTGSWTVVGLAELYLQAGEAEKVLELLQPVLTEFPSNAYAKLIAGKAELARGNRDAGLA